MTNIVWDELGGSTVEQRAALERVLQFSIDYINSLLVNPINFDVSAHVAVLDEGTIAQARSDYHQLDASGIQVAPVGMMQARNGVEVAGKDAIVYFNETVLHELFFDATPETGNDIPQNQFDLIGTVVHELLHALAFMTFSDEDTPQRTPMDGLLVQGADGMTYFDGAEAKAVLGGPVPLAENNFSHLGEAFGLGVGLMYPLAYYGYRSYISNLDLAMFRDMGMATIRGNEFTATDASNTFLGNAATDIFVVNGIDGAGTTDVFDGKMGFDIVRYSGARADYAVAMSDSEMRVTQNDSVDRLISIERVEFSDGVLLFDFDGTNADAAYRLYGGAFDRTPDEFGLRYWTFNWLNIGETLHDAAANFVASEEFVAKYGASISDLDYVSQLYQNILGRAGEAAGVSYWTDFLTQGSGDRADVLVQFTQLPEYVGISNADIENGYWVMAA